MRSFLVVAVLAAALVAVSIKADVSVGTSALPSSTDEDEEPAKKTPVKKTTTKKPVIEEAEGEE